MIIILKLKSAIRYRWGFFPISYSEWWSFNQEKKEEPRFSYTLKKPLSSTQVVLRALVENVKDAWQDWNLPVLSLHKSWLISLICAGKALSHLMMFCYNWQTAAPIYSRLHWQTKYQWTYLLINFVEHCTLERVVLIKETLKFLGYVSAVFKCL